MVNKLSTAETKPSGKSVYHDINSKRRLSIIVVSIILIVSIIADLMVGPSWISLKDIFKGVTDGFNGKSIESAIIWSIRLPMTMTCIVVGASLGLAGTQMQTILRNPLASPFTLGISAASGFGAAVAIITGFTVGGLTWLGVPVLAFVMSMIATLGIYLLGKRRGMIPSVLILSGIVVLFFFQSLQSFMQFRAAPEVLQQIVFWLFGSLLKSSWIGVSVSSGIFVVSAILLSTSTWNLTALSVGDERAKSLGVNTDRLRLKVFIISAFLTTGAVAFVGTISFVGLVAPHFARMFVGEDQRYLSPLAGIFGALIMVISSIIAKVVIPGAIIPIGIVTSLVGVPFLLYLILRRGALK